MPSRFDSVYKFLRTTVLTASNFNLRFRDIDDRLNPLESLKVSWEEALRVTQDKVLSRSEQVIGSLRDQLREIANLEWLTALSHSARTLAVGAALNFEIVEEDRELFTPGAWSMLTRVGSANTYAVVRNVGFDRETGRYDVIVVSLDGPPGPFSDWQFAALAGSTQAQQQLLISGLAAKTSIDGSLDAVTGMHAEILTAHTDVIGMHAEVLTAHADVIALADNVAAAVGGAAARDLARHAIAIAELRGLRIPGRAGWADAFGDTTGVDPSASSNEIYDAANDLYSNTAPAGDAWVRNNTGIADIGNDDLRGLATNGSYYIAVGLNGRILKSAGMDVSDWTVKVSGLGALQDCIYSPRLGLFVVVGAAGLIRTSPDGETWTAQTSSVATQLSGICETATHLVVVGASGVILTSTNATAWTAQTSGTTDDLRSVAHGAGATVAATVTSGRVHRSTNLTVWASVDMPTTGVATANYAHNLVFGGGYFLTVTNSTWRKSTNGVDWTEGTSALTLTSPRGLFWTGVRWILGASSVGGQAGGYAVSADGETWRATTHDGGGGYGGGYATSFASVGGTVTSAGNAGYIYTSTPPLAAMDLRSVAGALAAVPTSADLVVIAKGAEAITPGTHLTGYVSRNDGANWQEMSLVAAETYDGGYTVFEAWGVALISQPSGDDLRWRVVTTDDFAVWIAGVFVGAED